MRDGWTDTSLGEAADIRIGRTPARDNPRYWTSDLARPFCTIADMVRSPIVPVREGVTEAAEVEGKAKRVPAGSLLMSFKLTIGRVGIAALDLFPNEAIAWLEPKSRALDKRFLALWLEASDVASGAGRAVKGNTLNSDSLRALPVAYPSLVEQRRVVDLIDTVDTALRRAASAAGRAHGAASALVEDVLREQDHPLVTLRELAVDRGLIGGPFGSSLMTRDYAPAGVPVINGANHSDLETHLGVVSLLSM